MSIAFQLQQARNRANRGLLHTIVVVYRRVDASDNRGGTTSTYTFAYSTPGHIGRPTTNETLLAERHSTTVDALLWLPIACDVRASDHVVVDGVTYEAIDPGPDPTISILRRVPLRRVI